MTNTPPIPVGVKILASAVRNAYNESNARYPLSASDMMVALGAAAVDIINEVSERQGYDPDHLNAHYVAQFKVLPQPSNISPAAIVEGVLYELMIDDPRIDLLKKRAVTWLEGYLLRNSSS